MKLDTKLSYKIQEYKKSLVKTTNIEDIFVLVFDDDRLYVAGEEKSVLIDTDDYVASLILETYHTQLTRNIANLRKSFLYNKPIDNLIESNIKSLLLVPVEDNDNTLAIIWIAIREDSDTLLPDSSIIDSTALAIKQLLLSHTIEENVNAKPVEEMPVKKIQKIQDAKTVIEPVEETLAQKIEKKIMAVQATKKEETTQKVEEKKVAIEPAKEEVAQKVEENKTIIELTKTQEKRKDTDRIANILVVDDNIIIVKLIKASLKGLKFNIVSASNGEEAVEKFKSTRNLAVVFMDEVMPEGMLGHEAVKKMRDIEKKEGLKPITILGLTSDTTKETFDELTNAGVNKVLHKPIRSKDIYSAVECVL